MFADDRHPDHCPMCDTPAALFQENGVAERPGVDMLVCQQCHLAFQSDIPSQEDLRAYYWKTYRTEGAFKYTPQENFDKQAGLAKVRWDRYMSEMFSPYTMVLDLACGTGNMMRLAAHEGATVFGVEAYEPFAEKAREFGTVQTAMVEDMRLAQKFNTVFAFHILEHLRSPSALLNHLAPYITPGTRLFVECPNLRNVLISGYKYDPTIPRFARPHLWEFTPQSMTLLLQHHGWHVESAISYQRSGLASHLWQMFTGGHPDAETMTLGCQPPVRDALMAGDVAYRQHLEKHDLTDTFLIRAVLP